jgi:hypothetical protein
VDNRRLQCRVDLDGIFGFALCSRELEARFMATIDWSECPLVEVIPGKVIGAPLLNQLGPSFGVRSGTFRCTRGYLRPSVLKR